MTNSENIMNLTEMEQDIIGEVMNISMGAAATAMSTILDKKVSITTPRLQTSKLVDYGFTHLEPALGVVIKYVEGIDGLNMLILKEEDFKKILSHLLGMDPSEMTEFDEISMSAIMEIMNQMMGSASSALATFLGIKINISPPEILDTTSKESVQNMYSSKGEDILSIKFDIDIEDLVKSEFVSIMDPKLAREIIRMSMGDSGITEEEPPAPPQAVPTPPAPPQAVPPAEPVYQPAPPPQQAYAPAPPPPQQQPYAQAPPVAQVYQAAPQMPKQQVQAIPYSYQQFGQEEPSGIDGKDGNLDLIMSVPVQITVELGKTKRKIKDISEFAPGNIVELDRQAGDQVDIVANGRLIAKGDVVVVDDNYSVRITEIMKARDSLTELK